MAKRVTSITTITPAVYADAAALVDATYPFGLQGSGSTQRSSIIEVYLGGQATASAPAYMIVGMNSTAGAGTNSNGTGQTDAPLDPATAALAAPALTGNSWATTDPQRSATLKLLNLSFNAFGGLVRWVAAPGEEIYVVGNAVGLGSLSVSAFTGSSASATMGAHMIYETA
jgi:hypothetical protein